MHDVAASIFLAHASVMLVRIGFLQPMQQPSSLMPRHMSVRRHASPEIGGGGLGHGISCHVVWGAFSSRHLPWLRNTHGVVVCFSSQIGCGPDGLDALAADGAFEATGATATLVSGGGGATASAAVGATVTRRAGSASRAGRSFVPS